jgi:hypothetical protein
MDGPQFHVDIPKVEEAAKGIAASVDDQHHFKLKRLPGPAEMYGDDDLHDALRDYCDRWSDGLDILTDDARTIGDALTRVAQAYRATDEAAARSMTADPATGAVDG